MRVTIGWPFLLAVLAWCLLVAAGLALVDAAWPVLVLLLVAITMAGVLLAPAEALSRHMPRVLAVLLVVLAAVAVVGAITANQAWQLERHANAVAEAVESGIADLRPGSRWRRLLDEADVAQRSRQFLDQLPRTVVFGTADQGESARRGLDVVLVVILTIYGTLNGPQVARNLTGTIVDPHRRRLIHRAARAGLDRGAAYVRRSLAWGASSGLVVAALAAGLELEGPTTLALWAGVWSVVPVVGVLVGYVPIVGLVALDDPTTAALVAAVGLAWWGLGLVAVRRWVAAPTLQLGPLLVTMALAVGLQFGWLVGSLVSLFLLAWGAGFLAEVAERAETDDTPLRELTDDPEPDVPAGDPRGHQHQPAGGAGSAVAWRSLDPRAGARAAVLVVATVVALQLVHSAGPGPTWIIVGIVIGLALDPVARAVADRLHLPPGAAVGLVIGTVVVAVVALVAVAVPSLVDSLERLDEQVLQVADDLEELPLAGDELRRRGVGDRVRQTIVELPTELAEDPAPVETAVRTAGDAAVGTFWTFLVAVATLIDGRRIAARSRTLLPVGLRSRGDEVMALVYDTLVRYAAGSALVSGVVGLGVFAIAIALGVPLAPVLGVWALLWTFVPQIGGFMAAVPLVFLALVQGTTDGLLALVGYGVVWQVKNRVLMPVIVGRAVNLSPVVAMTSVLVGGAAAGLVGAVLATPLVGTLRLVYQHLGPHAPSSTSPPPSAAAGPPSTPPPAAHRDGPG